MARGADRRSDGAASLDVRAQHRTAHAENDRTFGRRPRSRRRLTMAEASRSRRSPSIWWSCDDLEVYCSKLARIRRTFEARIVDPPRRW